jgi:hypothetical protein
VNGAASATGWGDLYGHVVPGRTVRAGAWHVNKRGLVPAPARHAAGGFAGEHKRWAAGGLYEATGMGA